MASFLVSIPIVFFALWLMLREANQLWRARAGWSWWIASVAIITAGTYIGRHLSDHEFAVSPTLRVVGLPLPLGAFQLEDGNWTDFVAPAPVQRCNKMANTLIPVIIFLLPWLFVRHRYLQVSAPVQIPSPSPLV
ncbi:MAG: hypothetical protein WAU84_27180, partial [Thermoguttaceae bacterium]